MPAWRYIEDDAVTAASGLAADEFLMSYYSLNGASPEPTLRLYTYRSHCALVGRFQNVEAELDLEACRKLDVQFSRRPTGGGAILMGQNQLGLSLTAPSTHDQGAIRPSDVYRRFAEPVIRALAEYGIQARFRPKNDLEVDGRKIAGLGIYHDPNGAMLFHTSLLVDLDVELMLRVLKIPLEKVADKVRVSTIAQRTTTVSQELDRKVPTNEIRQRVKECFEQAFNVKFESKQFTPVEKQKIRELATMKYSNDEWTFQNSPVPDMGGMSIRKTPAGLIRTYISLKGEIIKSLLITGDFFEHDGVLRNIEAVLKWSPLEKASISRRVDSILSRGPDSLTLPGDTLVEAIWRAGINARAQSRLRSKGACYYPRSNKSAEV